jgi:putative transposase
MQIKCLPKSVYKIYNKAYSITAKPEIIKQRQKFLGDWEILKARRVPDDEIAKITGISRATYYRMKKSIRMYGMRGLEAKSKRPRRVRQSKIPKETIGIILNIRRNNPTYGKDKIAIILLRDFNIKLSASSIGRLIKRFLQKGLILNSEARIRKRRSRSFKKGHAKPWLYGTKITRPGQMVQIDHMVVTKNQLHFKHFQAWDPYTKSLVAGVYSDATSLSAKKFLDKVISSLPFKIKSIQVDGGSEFMAHFEQACACYSIELFVLPPKRPQYNGGVERANRTMREEFYRDHRIHADSIVAMRQALDKAVLKYNSYRPHHSLGGLTPLQYTNQHLMEQSQMY